MNRRMLTICCFCLIGLTATSQNTQPFFLNQETDTFPTNKVSTIVDTTGLRVQMGLSRTHISPYGLTLRLDSSLSGHYPIIIVPPEKHPDHVPFLFNTNSTEQLPYTGQNNVMMWGWNMGLGGANFISGKPAIGFSLESNYHPSGDPDTRWVESHEFYVKPNGQQVRLKSYTIGVPPSTEFIDLYHTTDNFHLRTDDQQDYFTINRNRAANSTLLNLESAGNVGLIIGRSDYEQSIQFQVTNDRVNITGKSKILALPGSTEFYLDAGSIGGVNTGYGLNAGTGIYAMGEMGERTTMYRFFTNNTASQQNLAIMSIGTNTNLFSGAKYNLIAYNNGIVTISKDWQEFSGMASLEVGRKSNAKTPLKLDDLPVYPSAADAMADGLEPGCLYYREGHGLDVIPPANVLPRTTSGNR